MDNQSPFQARAIAEQLVRYRKDFRLFAQEQLKLSGHPFSFWPCQMPVVEMFERQLADRGFVRAVILKARQVGMSTLVQGFVAWRAMLWPNVNAIVIGDESQRSQTLFEICRSFFDHLDPVIKPVGRYVTKRELVFANPSHITRANDPGLRSRVVVDSAHKRSIGIGAAWQFAHLSECARFKDPSFVLDGIIPAVHRVPGTFVVLESTAEMSGTWFRDFVEDARKGKNAFEAIFVPWWLQPEYAICPVCLRSYPNSCKDPDHAERAMKVLDPGAEERAMMAEFKLTPSHIQWVREKLAEMGNDWDLFRQSYPLTVEDAWVTPGMQAFPPSALRRLRDQIQPPRRLCDIIPGPKIVDAPGGKLWIWDDPQPGKAYDIGVDVASGLGEDDVSGVEETHDYSVICVLERGSNKQVAEWRSRAMSPLDLAKFLYWLGTYYNTAQVAVEINGIGGATNAELAKLGYSNVYQWRYRDEIVPRYSKKTGWETSLKSKPWLVGFANHELINDRVIIRSEILLKEMENYVRTGEREWAAVAGHRDDAVTAWMIALLTSDDENFERYYGLQKEVRDIRRPPGSQESKSRPEPWEYDVEWMNRHKTREALEYSPWD